MANEKNKPARQVAQTAGGEKTPADGDALIPLTVRAPIEHDGTRYEIGACLEVGERAAQALIAAGAAEAAPEQPAGGD